MKPALSPTTTGTLPRRSVSAFTSSMTSTSVTTVRITSTSFSTGAGLKKCIPTTCAGRCVATEISVTESEDVLVASMASGAVMRSSSVKIFCFSSRCSGTASTTRWQSARSSIEVVKVIRSKIDCRSSSVSLPRLTARFVDASTWPIPRVTPMSSRSTATTSSPLRAKTSDDSRAHRAEADDPNPGELTRHDHSLTTDQPPAPACTGPGSILSSAAPWPSSWATAPAGSAFQ